MLSGFQMSAAVTVPVTDFYDAIVQAGMYRPRAGYVLSLQIKIIYQSLYTLVCTFWEKYGPVHGTSHGMYHNWYVTVNTSTYWHIPVHGGSTVQHWYIEQCASVHTTWRSDGDSYQYMVPV